MSKKRFRITLGEYNRQIFPDRLDELNEALDKAPTVCGAYLKDIGREVPGYITGDFPPHSFDESSFFWRRRKYDWFYRLRFDAGKGELAVLFPWVQDRKKRDGVQLDRSIATLVKGEVPDLEVDNILSKLCSFLREDPARFSKNIGEILG